MSKNFGLYFFLLLFQVQAVAQQFVFPGYNYRSSAPYYYTCFDNRYSISYDLAVSILDTKPLKTNRVKKVLIYFADSTLAFSFELDTTGNVWRSGQWGGYYFTVNSEIKSDDWDNVHAVSYYEQSNLVRSDTTFVKYQNYKNKDTTMHFEKSKKRVYKIGYLVNEQNAYYNKKFYNKHYKGNSSNFLLTLPVYTFNSKGQVIPPDPNSDILLRKKLKTNYDSTRLYYCSEKKHGDNFYAGKDSGQTELPVNKLNKHRFYKQLYAKIGEKYFVSGESFYEPPEQHMSMWCGSSMYYQQTEREESRHFSSEIKYNDKGLYDTYYQLYYPVDTSAVKNEAAKQQPVNANPNFLAINIQPNFWQYSGYYQPRSPVPVKTRMYYFRYEYFENL